MPEAKARRYLLKVVVAGAVVGGCSNSTRVGTVTAPADSNNGGYVQTSPVGSFGPPPTAVGSAAPAPDTQPVVDAGAKPRPVKVGIIGQPPDHVAPHSPTEQPAVGTVAKPPGH